MTAPRRRGREPPKAKRGRRIAWRRAVTAFACETCGAAPGEDCITDSGAYAVTPHAYRTRLASADHWHNPDDDESGP